MYLLYLWEDIHMLHVCLCGHFISLIIQSSFMIGMLDLKPVFHFSQSQASYT